MDRDRAKTEKKTREFLIFVYVDTITLAKQTHNMFLCVISFPN